ncbi:hypothetical protein LWI29_034859 [Acer saccharum]|uniref:Uncharacterized protein n=1 Tax=Acer saccharum TaxID=4024 RepID=A0AA39RK04_ACESA|nr:hypothetical protein LWI29_034859 [Acer saccharum]
MNNKKGDSRNFRGPKHKGSRGSKHGMSHKYDMNADSNPNKFRNSRWVIESSSSVSKLEARLSRKQGKPSIPVSPSSTRVSCSTSSKTASAFGSIRPIKAVSDKGMGVIKAHKTPAPMVKEPPTLNDAEVVEAFRYYCSGGGLTSLSLTFASDVVARGFASVAEVNSSLVLCDAI